MIDRKKKRGVAMEFTIMVMLVIFALTALIVTISALSTSLVEDDVVGFERELELRELGEKFVQSVKDGDWHTNYPDAKDGDKYVLRQDDLVVVVEKTGDILKIVEWTIG